MPGRMLWLDTILNDSVASGGKLLVSLLAGGADDLLRLSQMTLMRTIVRMDLAAAVHDSGEGSTRLSWGIAISSQAAFDVGEAGLSDPSVASDHPQRGWVTRGVHRIWAFAADQPVIDVVRVDVNLQSRRKLDNGTSWILFDNDAQEGATVALQVVGLVRQLYLVS